MRAANEYQLAVLGARCNRNGLLDRFVMACWNVYWNEYETVCVLRPRWDTNQLRCYTQRFLDVNAPIYAARVCMAVDGERAMVPARRLLDVDVPPAYNVSAALRPWADVWVDVCEVWTVRGQSLQPSSQHTAASNVYKNAVELCAPELVLSAPLRTSLRPGDAIHDSVSLNIEIAGDHALQEACRRRRMQRIDSERSVLPQFSGVTRSIAIEYSARREWKQRQLAKATL